MMYFARNLFEQERRLKQYQEMILCLLYLTSCQLSIAHYNKQQISAYDLKHNKRFSKRNKWHLVGYKGLYLHFIYNFLFIKGHKVML